MVFGNLNPKTMSASPFFIYNKRHGSIDTVYASKNVNKNAVSHKAYRNMEQAAGIEPATTAWEAIVIPFNYACRNMYKR